MGVAVGLPLNFHCGNENQWWNGWKKAAESTRTFRRNECEKTARKKKIRSPNERRLIIFLSVTEISQQLLKCEQAVIVCAIYKLSLHNTHEMDISILSDV